LTISLFDQLYPMEDPMNRIALIAALAASLALPAAASADSLVFVKDHNVWLAEPDGSGQYQVTTDGTADNPYVSPSQADDGTIVAGRAKPNGGPLYRMKQNGKVLNAIPTQVAVAGPFRPHVSPDGQTVAYEHAFSGSINDYIETSSDVRFTRADGSTPGGLPGEVGRGSGSPSWIDSGRAMVGLNNVVHTVAPGAAPVEWWFDYDHYDWFGHGTNVEDGEYAGGNVAVVRGVDESADNTIQMYRQEGGFDTPPTPTCTISGPAAGPNGQYFADPTFSPDGRALAFQQGDGIHVMSFPSGNCLDGQPRLAIAGASQPDWGPAPVNPGEREREACSTCGERSGEKAQRLRLRAPKRISARALRKGLVLRVNAPAAGSLSATAALGGKRVASGRGKAKAAGPAKVRLRAAKRTARRLKPGKRLTLKVALRPAGGGKTQTGKATVRLGR
jgi:opacity protein-like surface antigen